jgi:hypothetical protein
LRGKRLGYKHGRVVVRGFALSQSTAHTRARSRVLGLIPIAPTVFWGPMAFAIMGGLFVATLLTLLVLPVFYITLYRAKQPADSAAVAA